MPNGVAWGLIMTFLEGRRGSDFTLAITSSSLMFSSAAVKNMSSYLMNHSQVAPFWIPAAMGSIFLVPVLLFAFLLAQTPLPNRSDAESKMIRKPMRHKERMEYLKEYWPGLIACNIAHLALCSYYVFRENFAREIARSMGEEIHYGTYLRIELSIGISATIGKTLL
jgi:hypothetical protein